MIPWLLFLLPVTFALDIEKTHGVPPSRLSQYKPLTGNTWKCVNASKEIPWSAVNDDYCDCPDGSDEPGTGACLDTHFYCQNEGHIGAFIPSSRVRDGLCEPACCDGSDEAPGVCKNTCQEVGAAYQAQQEAERKLRKTGSKIRSTYIAFAQKEKNRIEAQLATSDAEIAQREVEVARLKDILDRTESLSAAALEEKKKSPLFQSLMTHHRALKSLQREHKKHLAREKSLGDILDALRSGYNPNYQDMAVLEAVRGWEFHAGLPHINDVKKDDETEEEEGSDSVEEETEELEDGMWSEGQLEYQLDDLLNSDYDSLLLEHEKHTGSPTAADSLLFDPSAYIPASLLPQFEVFRDNLFSILEVFGIRKEVAKGDSSDASRAKQAFSDAEHSLNVARDEKRQAEEDISQLFDVTWFGREGEWKKLQNLCLEKNTGDYTYEVCLFDEARQKPNHGGSAFSLGRFASWNDGEGVEVGSAEYYGKQYYTQGTKCWNGPARSVQLLLACGTENALLTVQELEKCEYQFTGTTPALCLPLDATSKKDEL